MKLKDRFEDYSEAEFLEFLEEFFENKNNLEDEEFDKHINQLAAHFEKITEHPGKNGVIFHPEEGVEDSPQGVLQVVKEWRAANGKPGFKAEK